MFQGGRLFVFNWGAIVSVLVPILKTVLIVLIGHFVAAYIVKLVKRGLDKSKLDSFLTAFLAKSVNIALHILIILSALNSLGISTTGIIAAFSAGVVAIGLALKDSLSNVAGGILLLVSPRFSAGDFIEAGGNSGTVVSVDLLHTTVKTPDNKQISIPNGILVNSQITNYSKEQKRRVDITIPIPYETDAEFAKKIISGVVSKHTMVLSEPDLPLVRVASYGDSAVNIAVRCWCDNGNYWSVYFDLMEQIRASLEDKEISMPYNQLDVYIKNK